MTRPPPHRCGTLVYTTRGLVLLFIWLLWGDFCFTFMENVVPSLMPLKLKALNASNTAIASIIVTVPSAINTVFNPIISFRSDRFRSRWGRRLPFLLFSLPFLVVSLVVLGCGDSIGPFLHHALGSVAAKIPPGDFLIGAFAGMVVLFSVFNTFANSTFWYLFNDVVPEELLARFMSWFRVIGLISTTLYNYFVFPYATSHFREILIGTALLYLFGFGLMCWKVREGEYLPPPKNVGGQAGVFAAVMTFVRECFSLRHYWWLFLSNFFVCAYAATQLLMVFFFQGTGLNLVQIGEVQAAITVATAIFVLGSGWLADRYHPIRVVIAGQFLQVAGLLPVSCIWLFWHPVPSVAFAVWMAISLLLAAPTIALTTMGDPPLLMRIFPRERYGQFCSANAICKSLGLMLGGFLTGYILDFLGRTGNRNVYAYLPVIQLLFSLPPAWLLLQLYRSWKVCGGDTRYQPPLQRDESG